MSDRFLSGVDVWLMEFGHALNCGDSAAAAALFAPDGFWRDLVAFTWTIRTLEGRGAIKDMLEQRLAATGSTNWSSESSPNPSNEGFILFETAHGTGRGYVRLHDGLCVTLLTTLDDLKGFEERSGRNRSLGAVADSKGNWRDQLNRELAELGRERQPYVLIVGGGQGGLGLAARLRQLDVPAIVVDRYARSGDQWRSRYKSLSLHDPVWYDHMPYLPFPDTWPVFTPKDKIADWLESYANIMELNVWHSTDCTGATYDAEASEWVVTLKRDGEAQTLRPKHLVLATGNAGKANMPAIPGADDFTGKLYHSSAHPGGEGFSGKRVAVIGSNNSAHDICADLAEHGVDVTMVQRSSTHIVKSQTFNEVVLASLYSEDALAGGISTDRADMLNASLPIRMLPTIYKPMMDAIAARDAAFYQGLEAAGFLHDFGEDGTGLPLKYLRRSGGYYIDVGASAMIVDGRIKLRAGVGIDRIETDKVVLSDGTSVPADVIIYATGYGSMDEWAAELISPEVARSVGKVWGYGSDTRGDPGPWEGELRNMWKPTAQEGLWFHGGNLAQSRFYSKFLALQLKARMEHLPVEVCDA